MNCNIAELIQSGSKPAVKERVHIVIIQTIISLIALKP